jgi:hypothetical protein
MELRLFYVGPVCSINAKFGHAKSGRAFLTQKYRNFKQGMVETFKGQRSTICPIENKVIVRVMLHVGNRLDVDALEKPILDCLQVKIGKKEEGAGIIRNDKLVKGYFLWNAEDIREDGIPSIEIRIQVIGDVYKQNDFWEDKNDG